MNLSRWLVACVAIVIMSAGQTVSARAQSGVVPAEIEALYEDIMDIDKLRVLNPLKLKPDQVDKLISTITQSRTDYHKAVADAAVPPIKEIARQIKDTRRRMVEGAEIPKDFDEKVKKIQEKFVERRNKAEFDTVKSLAESIKKILTADQFATAEKLAKKALTEEGKEPPKIVFFNFYVLTVIIQYPRIIPLLEEIKKGQSGS